MNKKTYYFSYGNVINFLFTFIVDFICMLGLILFVFFISLIFFSQMQNYLIQNTSLQKVLLQSSIALPSVVSLYLLINVFIPKKVILSPEFVKIRRHNITEWSLLHGLNDKIFIDNIVACKIYDGDRPILDRRNKPYVVVRFNWDDLVEVTTDKRKYLIPVKNSADFVEEVNKWIGRIKN